MKNVLYAGKQRSAVRFEFPVRPVATRDECGMVCLPSGSSEGIGNALYLPTKVSIDNVHG